MNARRAGSTMRSPASETPPPMTNIAGSNSDARSARPDPSHAPTRSKASSATGSPSRAAAVMCRPDTPSGVPSPISSRTRGLGTTFGRELARLAHQGVAARVLLPAPALAAAAQAPVRHAHQVAELGGHAVGAADQPVAVDDPAADARADRDHDERRRPLAGAEAVLAPGRRVRVVLHDRGEAGAEGHGRAEGLLLPAQVRREAHDRARLVDEPGSTEPDARHGAEVGVVGCTHEVLRHTDDGGHDLAGRPRRCVASRPQEHRPGLVDEAARDLGAADVDTDGHGHPRAFRDRGRVARAAGWEGLDGWGYERLREDRGRRRRRAGSGGSGPALVHRARPRPRPGRHRRMRRTTLPRRRRRGSVCSPWGAPRSEAFAATAARAALTPVTAVSTQRATESGSASRRPTTALHSGHEHGSPSSSTGARCGAEVRSQSCAAAEQPRCLLAGTAVGLGHRVAPADQWAGSRSKRTRSTWPPSVRSSEAPSTSQRRSTGGSATTRRCGPSSTTRSPASVTATVDLVRLGSGHGDVEQPAVAVGAHPAVVPRSARGRAGRSAPRTTSASARSASTPTGSSSVYGACRTGSAANRSRADTRPSRWRRTSAGRPLVAHGHPVDDDALDVVAEHRERGARALGLGEHDALRRGHEAHGGLRAGRAARARASSCGAQRLHGVERLDRARGDARVRPRSRAMRCLDGEAAGHEPVERLGQRQQPQRLGRRRAVDDDRVVAGGVPADLEQREDVLARRDGRDLLRDERVDARAGRAGRRAARRNVVHDASRRARVSICRTSSAPGAAGHGAAARRPHATPACARRRRSDRERR